MGTLFDSISNIFNSKRIKQNKEIIRIFAINNKEYFLRGDVDKPIYYFIFFEKKQNKTLKIIMFASSYSRLREIHGNIKKNNSIVYIDLFCEVSIHLARPDFDNYDLIEKNKALTSNANFINFED